MTILDNLRTVASNLIHPDQAFNARNRNLILPERYPSDLVTWKATSRGADGLRTKQSHTGETVRTAATPEDEGNAIRRARVLRDSVHAHERELACLEKSHLAYGLRIPSTSHPDVPRRPESNAQVVSTHGLALMPTDPKRDHNEPNALPRFKFFDRDAGVVSSGVGFAYLKGGGALRELALIAYAMEVAVRRGFESIVTPDVARRNVADRCGFVPRDDEIKGGGVAGVKTPEQMYGIHSKHGSEEATLVLSGTSKIPLTAEAGARGKYTLGLYRVHQFTRVKLFSITVGERVKRTDDHTTLPAKADKASDKELEDLRELQIELYAGLGITFWTSALDMPSEEHGA
ncbi:unnamed protein product [Rhizoctonia solani]|uniref:Uncharacterized protein n=1 Tax=Rhizoctonia solani TaxID=456999 RepID=A0A8H3DZB3_9AGAM|nr:unnamed protein product [Rhizoctonia solani]